MLRKINLHIDWVLFISILPIIGVGLITMSSFVSENYFASRQIIWALVSFAVFFAASFVDWRFLRRSSILVGAYLVSVGLLLFLFLGSAIRGVQSWLDFGLFSVQPADVAKLVLILVLAKYFSRRHVEIANLKHIIISGIYALVVFVLVLLQPDFGSAIIVFLIWFGMVLISGVSKKHILSVAAVGAIVFFLLWSFVFAPYQKDRIQSFLNPLADIQGAGYNAFQSTLAVGSGQVFGKGVGFGTQSRLEFLPEYQTDFIFAAFAEEWGLVGVLIFFGLFGVVIWRVIASAMVGASNFEIFFGAGVAMMLIGHFVVHVGMNIGLLPVTGIPLPFMSYGGSHLFIEFLALGILMGMRRYSRGVHKGDSSQEFIDIQ